ncbi:MAG: hypothetical protein LBT96_02030 [Campylobacteraceae bacterium]|jgi:hypothetical protein|nr:hypothetical protein [Campylobacteraceae bacterium]
MGSKQPQAQLLRSFKTAASKISKRLIFGITAPFYGLRTKQFFVFCNDKSIQKLFFDRKTRNDNFFIANNKASR